MARVLVLTDLNPQDTQWKGAVSWRIIQSLAESQHEVLVVTPLALENITLTHSRLTVTRPISSWRADQMIPLSRVLLRFRPQVIHTFALEPSRMWPNLTLWPYLTALTKMVPKLRRISTLFDEADAPLGHPGFEWHQTADAVTVFCERHRARLEARLKRSIQVVPLEEMPEIAMEPVVGRVLVPAAVSEWTHPETGLQLLAGFCERHPEARPYILGGWGDWTALQRKEGWRLLEKVSERVHMSEELPLAEFSGELRASSALWLEPLAQDSWRYLLSSHLARQMNKQVYLPNEWSPALTRGSTANSLSRLYLTSAPNILV